MYVHRLGSRFLKCPERIEAFFDYLDEYPDSCQQVWLSSLYGFPKIEKHIEMAEEFKSLAKRLRDKGIGVSLQISNTLGHGPSGLSNDNTGLFENEDNMIVKERRKK